MQPIDSPSFIQDNDLMRFTVGITGGIGSGKSAVTDRLQSYGIAVVDADVVARVVVEPGRPALDAIRERYGQSIMHADGTLNRAALRSIVFENSAERHWLESVTHPAIRIEMSEQLAHATSPYAVLSSPLLLESGQNIFAHYVVVVDVPEAVQLERTMARDNNEEALVKRIMAAQLTRDERCEQANEVLDNRGSLQDLYNATDALHQRLLLLAEGFSA